MDKINQRTIPLFRIFTENVQSRYGYQNNYLLTDIFKILYPEKQYSVSEIRSFWKGYTREKNKNRIINFYIHIPYCIRKCSYCICSSSPMVESKELSEYLDNLIKSFQYFKKTFDRTVFNNLYIGGGTPSIMTENQLDFLFNSLFHNFRFNDSGEKTMELNPISANLEKLSILKKHGFNRVSFGVQSLDSAILKYNNRDYQNYHNVKNAITNAKKAGFKHINSDLMLGLFGDTKEKFSQSFKKIAALRPSSICVYPLQPKTDYIAKYFKSNLGLFNDYYESLVKEITPVTKALAKKNGYVFPEISLKNIRTASPWFFILKDAGSLKSRYSFDARDKSSIFALGFEGNSYIYNKIRYHNLALTKNPKNNICEGVIFNKRMEMIHYILRVFSYEKWISRKDFKENFSVDLIKEFNAVFKILKRKLFVDTKNTDRVYYTSYQPKERFLNSLFFFDKKLIVERMNDFSENNLIRLIINDKEFIYRIGYSKKISGLLSDNLYSLKLLNRIVQKDKTTKEVLNFINAIFLQICVSYKGAPAETIKEILYGYILKNAEIVKNKIGIRSIYVSKC